MAKGKTKEVGLKRIQCAGYELRTHNDPERFRLALIVQGTDGKTYNFGVDDIQDSPGLVMEMFDTLGVWPSFTFFMTIDNDGNVTSFSRS